MINKNFEVGFEKVAIKWLNNLRYQANLPSTKAKGIAGMALVGTAGAGYGGYKLMDKITDAPQGPQQDW